MEALFEKIPFIGKVVISFLLSVAIPSVVSFTILQLDVEHLQAQATENRMMLAGIQEDRKDSKKILAEKLEEIQRSIGRLEGKIDNLK